MSEALAEPRFEAAPRRLTTVVAADICGYSRLAEIDDDAAIRTVNFVRAAFEQVVERRRGRLFHMAGDGFLAEFPSAADGVLAALEFVADIKSRDKLSPINPGAKVRAGVHAGDVLEQPGGDLLGHGVNVAARLQAEAEPNGVLVSLAVVNLVRGSVGAQFSRRGPLALRNIDEPVVAFDAAITENAGTLKFRLRASRRLTRISPSAATLAALGLAILVITGATLRNTTQEVRTVGRAPADNWSAVVNFFSKSEQDYLDRQFLAGVLESLSRSQNNSANAILTLIESGDVERAIRMLKDHLLEPGLSSDQYIELNHQIGAIAELAAPAEAVAAFHRILARNSADFFAAARLGHAYLAQSNVDLGRKYYQQALEIGHTDPKVILQLRNELTFAFNLERRQSEAIAGYRQIINEAVAIGFEEIEASARTSLGIALVHSERLDEAREQFISVLVIQPEDKYLSSKARAAWGIGQVARKTKDFSSAERFYHQSLEYETRAGRAHGRATSLFYLALNDINASNALELDKIDGGARGRLLNAERYLNQSLEIAEQQKITLTRNMALSGLSHVKWLLGDQSAACAHADSSAQLLASAAVPVGMINPEVLALVSATGCPYSKLTSSRSSPL